MGVKTYGQIVQQFAYITQVASPLINPANPYGPRDPNQGVYFQEVIMGDQLDEYGNPVLDEFGNPYQIAISWDEDATNAVYAAWREENQMRGTGE